ncbi:MAG: TIGR03915 family putative DNA repair protein [Kiritimatiellae bacterium]|nr:TIGR03915 family putative DNA repair protein [Kiritimatiellia bacterium]
MTTTTIRHDGSADGLLCALAAALRSGETTIVEGPSGGVAEQLPLGETSVPADSGTAETFLRELRQQLGDRWVRRVLRLCCAEDPSRDRLLLEWLRLAQRYGADVDGYHAHPVVRAARRLERRVSLETHRFQGLLRFRRLATGRLWGPIEPDHDIVPLLAPFFRHRLGAEAWLIHDVRRGYGIGWTPPALELRGWTAAEIERELAGGLHASELAYQSLWRTFYRSVSIAARRSPRLQRRCMPVRYWRHLVEQPGEGGEATATR